MVSILEKLSPQAESLSVILHIDDKFIIPVKWLFFHSILGNLQLTKSVSDIRKSRKMTDKVLIEMLSDFNFMENIEGYNYEYIVNCWKRDKQWRGMVPTQNRDAKVKIVLQGRTVVESYYNCIYDLNNNNTVSCLGNAAIEFKYNQDMLDFFGSKFPIELKSLAPVFGEETAILG